MEYRITLKNKRGEILQVPEWTYGPIEKRIEADIIIPELDEFYKGLHRKFGIMWLHRKPGRRCITKLAATISKLGIDTNLKIASPAKQTGYALLYPLLWAIQYHEGIFEVEEIS